MTRRFLTPIEVPDDVYGTGWNGSSEAPTKNAVYDKIETVIAAGGGPLAAWPIGSVFIAVVSTSPATLLGGGTWVRFGQGRMLVSQSSDVDFDTAEETGGAKTVTLVEANLPSHDHTLAHTHTIDHNHPVATSANPGVSTAHTHGIDHGHVAEYTSFNLTGTGSYVARRLNDTGTTTGNLVAATTTLVSDSTSIPHTHTVDVPTYTGNSGGSSAANTGLAGSGTAVNNLPPYIVTYMWKRTA